MASSGRTDSECALVRAAADDIIAAGRDRNYVTMARGTLAALDWVEGRTDRAPSTGEVGRPEDIFDGGRHYQPTFLQNERNWSEDWGRGHIRPPAEDMHFHGAVWAVLMWWHSGEKYTELSISVPALDRPWPSARAINEPHDGQAS